MKISKEEFESAMRDNQHRRDNIIAYNALRRKGLIREDNSIMSEGTLKTLRHKPYKLDWGDLDDE